MNAQGDSAFNRIDSVGKKVGLWVIIDSTEEYTLKTSSVWHKGNVQMSCEQEIVTEWKCFVREFGSFENGLKEGRWNTFYTNGTLKGSYEFKAGELQPTFLRFTENNSLKYEIHKTDSPTVFKVIDISKNPSQERKVKLKDMNVFYE